jgi:adenylate cyclase
MKSKGRIRLLRHSGILVGVGFAFIVLVGLVQPFSHFNRWLSDQLFVSQSVTPNVVLASIDDDTLKAYGRWEEWPRSLHAGAIGNLSQAGAMVIGFDVLFADTSADDAVLAQAIGRAKNVILAVAGTESLPPAGSVITYNQFLLPTIQLMQAAANVGHANIIPDNDGVVRRLPLIVQDSTGQTHTALSLVMLYNLFGKRLPDEYAVQGNRVHVLDRDIPVDNLSSMRINFVSDEQGFISLSYADVISGNFDPSLVKGKMVLIGMTATGGTDAWATPISPSKVPGVWIHACAIDTILGQKFLIEVSGTSTISIILFLVAILALVLPRLELRWGGFLAAGLFIGYVFASFIAFDTGYILDMLYPLAILPLMYVTNVLCVVSAEQSDKRLIRDLFGRYVSPQVATEILNMAESGRLELGGERREVTVFFADARGFTQMSEQALPESVVETLNKYLSAIVARVLTNDGMVNKFAGDNIMAVWNAPQHQKEHALLAVKTAWEAQQAIAELQEQDTALQQMQFGIGINTGEVIAGNVGSSGRSEYTVIGDAVNLASRICSAAPGGEVWIGEDTYQAVKDCVVVQELKSQTFKGKAEPISVYRIVGFNV